MQFSTVRQIRWHGEKPTGPAHLIFTWSGYPLFSKAFRSAALGFACQIHGVRGTPKALEYRKYFRYTRDALDERSFIEAATTIYLTILNEFAANEGLEEVMRHFDALCTVVQHLKLEKILAEHSQLLKRVFRGALQAMRVAGHLVIRNVEFQSST